MDSDKNAKKTSSQKTGNKKITVKTPYHPAYVPLAHTYPPKEVFPDYPEEIDAETLIWENVINELSSHPGVTVAEDGIFIPADQPHSAQALSGISRTSLDTWNILQKTPKFK